jgi:hypothetical protein
MPRCGEAEILDVIGDARLDVAHPKDGCNVLEPWQVRRLLVLLDRKSYTARMFLPRPMVADLGCPATSVVLCGCSRR